MCRMPSAKKLEDKPGLCTSLISREIDDQDIENSQNRSIQMNDPQRAAVRTENYESRNMHTNIEII